MNWLALDIGGANLKLADGKGYASSQPFALWQDYDRLELELRSAIAESPPSDHLAVTMTGELADCFADKLDGVRFILQSVHEAADGRHTRVYLVDGSMVSPSVARSHPLMVASSNWQALARYCGRFAKHGPALLIDIGSTTIDLVPLFDGRPVCTGFTDIDRLMAGELIYTGIERSPVCALVDSLPYRGRTCPVAQEVFATTLDVYLLTGDLPESDHNHHTADHRPATKNAACRRLGRMISADSGQFNESDAEKCAQHVADAQLNQLTHTARRVIDRLETTPRTVVVTGHGDFLVRRLLTELDWSGHVVSLVEELGPIVSRCAPAHALAVLAREMTDG